MCSNLDDFFDGISEEEQDDAFIECIKEKMRLSGPAVETINPKRIKDVLFAYNILKRLVSNQPDVEVTYRLNEPIADVGSVCICGKNININNPDLFMKVVDIADCEEVYQKRDRTVVFEFTFYGLTI